MERGELSDIWKAFSSLDPAIWAGVLAAVITIIIELVLLRKKIIFASGEKKIEQAIKAGNVIKGVRVSCRHRIKNTNTKARKHLYIATYEYSLHGRTRKKIVNATRMEPPETLTLYYLGSSGKAFSRADVSWNPLEVLLYIIPLVMAFLVLHLLGFKG